jgi:hypothetical protein
MSIVTKARNGVIVGLALGLILYTFPQPSTRERDERAQRRPIVFVAVSPNRNAAVTYNAGAGPRGAAVSKGQPWTIVKLVPKGTTVVLIVSPPLPDLVGCALYKKGRAEPLPPPVSLPNVKMEIVDRQLTCTLLVT